MCTKKGLGNLVNRYQQLNATSLDAQQRATTHLAEVRARPQPIKQLLRTVDAG